MSFVFGLIFFIVATLYQGFVFAVLWSWFATPLGAPIINIQTAICLMFMVGLASPNAVYSELKSAREAPEGENFKILVIHGFIAPSAMLVIGRVALAFSH